MSRIVIINEHEYPEFRFAWEEAGPLWQPDAHRRVIKAPRTALGYGLLGPVAPAVPSGGWLLHLPGGSLEVHCHRPGALGAHRSRRLLAGREARTSAPRRPSGREGSPMIALILKNGALEQIHVHGPDRNTLRVRGGMKRAPVRVRLTRRERRWVARDLSGPGRRASRRVTPSVMRLGWVEDIHVFNGHVLRGRPRPFQYEIEVRLFLPAGQGVTDEHCRDVERWLREQRG